MPEPRTFAPHVEWLRIHRGPALLDKLANTGLVLDLDAALGALVEADPSPGLHGVQWLCDTYLAGGYRWEDLAGGRGSKVCETLGLFAQVRRLLPPGQRNLEHYSGVGELWQAIEPHLDPAADTGSSLDGTSDQPGSRQLRRDARLAAYKDSIILYNTAELIVAVPLSHEASRWWGLGTRWCTAATNNNMFAQYHRHAPLIVAVLPGLPSNTGIAGGKLQLYFDPGEDGKAQFMDSSDRDVDPEFVHQHWHRLAPLISWAVAKDASLLRYVPQHAMDEHMCKAAVAGSEEALYHVPRHLRTHDVYLAAVEHHPGVFRFVPPEYQSVTMCQALARATMLALRTMPEAMKTREMCRIAVSSHGQALAIIPPEFVDADLCMTAVRQDGNALQDVPRHLRTPQIYMAAVRSRGAALRYVPLESRTPELCLIAVTGCGTALTHVPSELRDINICEAALDQEGMALLNVPQHLRGPEVFLRAVRSRGTALNYVLWHEYTDEILETALGMDGRVLGSIPEPYQTQKLCRLAVEQNPAALSMVPHSYMDESMCLNAVHRAPHMSGFIPKHLLTGPVWIACIAAGSLSMSYLPPEYRNFEFYSRLYQANPQAYLDNRNRNPGHKDNLDADMHARLISEHPNTPRPPVPKDWNADAYFADLGKHLAPSAQPELRGPRMS